MSNLILFPLTLGCTGTTRLIGAGKVPKKSYSIFGPREGEPGRSQTLAQSAKALMDGSSTFKYEDGRRPPVPSKDDKPVYGIKTSKNFITANAVEAILQVPRTIPTVDLNYLKKEDFGKVPGYLTQVKEEIARENEMISKYVKEQLGEYDAEPTHYEEMDENDRASLVLALKNKWDKVNAQYQKITHLVHLDTTGQIRRKERFEKELQEIENDIQKLERNGPVLLTR